MSATFRQLCLDIQDFTNNHNFRHFMRRGLDAPIVMSHVSTLLAEKTMFSRTLDMKVAIGIVIVCMLIPGQYPPGCDINKIGLVLNRSQHPAKLACK